MWLACVVELVVVAYLASPSSLGRKLTAVAWLACLFVTYRLGLHWIGGDRHCACLGSASQWFPWLERHERILLHGILTFMYLGSMGLLCWLQVTVTADERGWDARMRGR